MPLIRQTAHLQSKEIYVSWYLNFLIYIFLLSHHIFFTVIKFLYSFPFFCFIFHFVSSILASLAHHLLSSDLCDCFVQFVGSFVSFHIFTMNFYMVGSLLFFPSPYSFPQGPYSLLYIQLLLIWIVIQLYFEPIFLPIHPDSYFHLDILLVSETLIV